LVAKKNHVNRTSVFSAIDLVPTLLDFTGSPHPKNANYDGESLIETLLGKSDASRKAPIYFRRPPERDSFYGDKDFPDLAVRDGKWKFLPIFPFKGEEKTGWIARWTFSLAGGFYELIP
jgi:uncharacterized sulfatase